MPPINLGTPPASLCMVHPQHLCMVHLHSVFAWYTPSSVCSTHRVWSMHLLRVPPDHTHTCTQSNHITSSLYNSTILHTITTRQGHIYVKKTVGEWWGIWVGGKWGWMFARGTLSSDWRTLSKKLWATLLCHTTRRRRSSVVLSQQPNIAHMHRK